MAEMNGKEKIIDIVFFTVCASIMLLLCWHLFYGQSVRLDGRYLSDMYAYVLYIQGVSVGLSFPYPVFFLTAKVIYKIFFRHHFLGPELGIAIATLLFYALLILVVKYILNIILYEKIADALGERKSIAGPVITVLSFSVLIVSMLYLPEGMRLPGISARYAGVSTPNPWHNATIIAARPFAILTFYAFYRLMQKFGDGGFKLKEYFFFSVSLFLLTMTKPSLVFVVSSVLISVGRFVMNGCKGINRYFCLVLCYLPTVIALLYQYLIVFSADDTGETGIGFAPGRVWSANCGNIPAAVILGMCFPIAVLLFNLDALKGMFIYRFVWFQYIIAFLTAFFLYEKGFREADGNFFWGYMDAMFFCYGVSLIILVKKGLQKKTNAPVIIQWSIYFLHILCGGLYFADVLFGNLYV